MSLTHLAGAYRGEDVWVIAAGPSMDYVDPSFFDGRVTVGVNDVWSRFPVTYAVRKEHFGAQAVIDAGVRLILAEGDMGGGTPPKGLNGPYWLFPHEFNESDGPLDLDVIGSDLLVVSWSTITTAIHFAAYLGARAVFVAGHDCGTIDGRTNFDGYHGYAPGGFTDGEYRDWLGRIEYQTMQVAERVTAVYGCPVVGLNPWPSLALAGHVHSGRVAVTA